MSLNSRVQKALQIEAQELAEGLNPAEDDQTHHHEWNDDTKDKQKNAIQLWTSWIKEKSIGDEYLVQSGFSMPSAYQFKQFARFVARSSTGRIEPVPSSRYVSQTMSHVFSAILAGLHIRVPETINKDVHAFVKVQLLKEGRVTSKAKPKKGFKEMDRQRTMKVHWNQITQTPRTGHDLVDASNALNSFCFTGARIGALFPPERSSSKGLRYKDLELQLLPRANKTPEMVLTFSQTWIKNNTDANAGLRLALSFREDFLRDPIPFFLARAFVDGAFQDFTSPAELLEQQVPAEMDVFPIKWKPESRDVPIFRVSKDSHESMPQWTYRPMFKTQMVEAGYTKPVTIHRIRQEVCNVADKNGKATPSQRKHALGQTQTVYDQSYIDSMSSLNLQSLFLGEEPRQDHIEKLQSVSCDRIEGYPTKLPKRSRVAAFQDPVVRNLEKMLEAKRQGDANTAEVEKIEKNIRATKSRLLSQALKNYQSDWVDSAYKIFVDSRGKAGLQLAPEQRRSRRFLEFMPERSRVCAALGGGAAAYSEEGRLALIEDLVVLAGQESVELYRPNEVPIDKRCPVAGCEYSCSSNLKDTQTHIHSCREREFLRTRLPGQRSAYCYQCFLWLNKGTEWTAHCQFHLDNLNRECGPIFFRGFVLSPGFCPFCLGAENLTVTERCKQWLDSGNLLRHIDQHLKDIVLWPLPCPHPLCVQQLHHTLEDIAMHFESIHGFQDFQPFKLRPRSDESTRPSKRKPGMPNQTTPSKRTCRDKSSSRDWETDGDGFAHWRTPGSPKSRDGSKGISIPRWLENFDGSPEPDNSLCSGNMNLQLLENQGRDFDLPFLGRDDFNMDEFVDYASPESLQSISALFSEPQDPAHLEYNMSPATSESLPSISVLFNNSPQPAHLKCDMSSTTSVNCEKFLNSKEAQDQAREFSSFKPTTLPYTSSDSCPKCATGPGTCDQCEWERRRYPSINWNDLPNRLEKLQPWLKDCLEKKDVPIFRDAFIKNTKSTKLSHDFIYGERSGYYGPRGEALVCEQILWNLSGPLRAAKENDPVVKRSTVDYVMQVLTPAAIVRLIMEDLNQDEGDAARTLKASGHLGMSVNEE